MQVHLCKRSLERAPAGPAAALESLRAHEHVPVIKDCLNRCERCERGDLIAVVDGMPLAVPTVEALVAHLDALAADEL